MQTANSFSYDLYDAQEQVKKLVSPLTEISNIHFFSYGRYSVDTRECLMLCNTNTYLQAWNHDKKPFFAFALPNGWHLWESHLSHERIACGQELDIGKGIYYVQHQSDCVELFSFASRPDDSKAYDFYLNNDNFLKRFSYYFKNEAKNILLKSKKNSYLQKNIILNNDPNSGIDSTQLRLLEKMSYPFNLLSSKEGPCYRLFLQGYTNREISEILDISPSTVDAYFSRIKKKLGCQARSESFQKATAAGLIEYHLEILDRH